MRYYLSRDHYTEFRSGSPALHPNSYEIEHLIERAEPGWSFKFRVFKTVFDYGFAVVALPLIIMLAAVLLVLNPYFNPGPLFFRQARIGQYGQLFHMWKFRSMVPSGSDVRDPNAALEEDRITGLGRLLRVTRIDEIPNFINVLYGEMSVIGPRPDAASHVEYYTPRVRGYSERHRVKPGITGLAQVEQGYVEDEEATAVKAKYDNMYVSRSCGRLDLYIIVRTFHVMLSGFGAK